MEVILKLAVMGFGMGLVMLALYRSGWMVLSQKTALTFVGGRRGKSAHFSRCSGELRRVLRPGASRSYTFLLECRLSDGEMQVLLLGPGKTELLCLSAGQACGSASLEKNKGYILVLRFLSATGRYTLNWY